MNLWKRELSDPIRGLTLDRLARQIDSFQNGYLAEFALSAEAMENRDDILKNVITKRKKAVTRHGWEILTEDCSAHACEQRDVLEYFYRNLQCSHTLRGDERGGFQLLVYQMMDAVGKGFAVHEILWKPVVIPRTPEGRVGREAPVSDPYWRRVPFSSPSNIRHSQFGNQNSSFTSSFAAPHSSFENRHSSFSPPSLLTAEFRFVPLWYFEATTGRLRFVSSPGALHGEPLAEKQWLVTVGDALMIACSRAFLFKHYPLQAWLDFSQKFGLPGLRGVTSAARGTPEFEQMEDALQTFMSELAVVTNTAESIDLIELKGSGQHPFAELVERMDRVMASLWRGADLSTLSRDRGYGATLQEQESRVLEQDDAQSISEHLNSTVDRWVLEQVFGPSVQPLARIKILVSPKEGTPHDLAIDEFLLRHGGKLSLSDTMERYGRAPADADEPALSAEFRSQPARHVSRGEEPNNPRFGNAHSSNPRRPFASSHSSLALRNSQLPGNFQPGTFNLNPISQPSTANHYMTTKLHNSTTPSQPANLEPSTFNATQSPDSFIQLSPIGIFPHARGFQNVDRTALETIVKNFKSFFGRLGRRFAGLPFYVGHPDVPGYENVYNDRKAYGWIMDLEVRDDGLYGRTNWSAAGRELIGNRHYKFLSPYWEAIRIGSKEGRTLYSPTVLKSVGLTNEPNLPVLPLANSESPGDEPERACLGTPLTLHPHSLNTGGTSPARSASLSPVLTSGSPTSVSPTPSAEPIETTLLNGGTSYTSPTFAAPDDPIEPDAKPSALVENSTSSTNSTSSSSLSPQCLRGDSDSQFENRHSSLPSDSVPHSQIDNRHSTLSDLEQRISQLNDRLIQTLLDNALAQSRILPIERAHWHDALAKDFENASAALANTQQKLNSTPRSANLIPVHAAQSSAQTQSKILSLVNERMHSTGSTYHQAWLAVREAHPTLFPS
jgi:hypothetical protein